MSSAYNEEQVDRYLEILHIPERFLRKNNPKPDLEFLQTLHAHQLCTIPFEDLAIHYSKGHAIILDPQFLYRKFVTPNGRGGYCMENNIFYNHMLRALGFNAYLTGGRVRPRTDGIPGGAYMGWVHCVNIVKFPDGSRYMTDVGYGGDGPIMPLPMVEGVVTQNIGTQELQLAHEVIPGQVDQSQKQWIYQLRNDASKEFNSGYCFTDQEFIEQDFEVMSYFTSTHPSSYMTATVVMVRYLHHNYKIYGKRMLVNAEIKENSGGKSELLRVCMNEKERIEALKTEFGVTLSEEEQQAIYETRMALT